MQFTTFTRDEWAGLRASVPLTLTEGELSGLRGLNDRISLDDVADIYLPLTRLLNLKFSALRELRQVTARFLGRDAPVAPFVIGLAGSVAVGKSTAARLLRALLSRWPQHPRVDLVTTDGFLFPNAVLEARGLMARKGFPESYDRRALIRFLRALRAGAPEVHAPIYSHLVYDIVDGETLAIRQPDILIVEGLNVLQRPAGERVFVSDFFDFTVYLDAAEDDIARWYEERFFTLRATAFQDPSSYFTRFASLTDTEASALAQNIWTSINGPNLRENIAPSREHAQAILTKDADHAIRSVRLRTD